MSSPYALRPYPYKTPKESLSNVPLDVPPNPNKKSLSKVSLDSSFNDLNLSSPPSSSSSHLLPPFRPIPECIVKNLPDNFTRRDVEALFRGFNLRKVELSRTKKGVAVVTFGSWGERDYAVKKVEGKQVGGRKLLVLVRQGRNRVF